MIIVPPDGHKRIVLAQNANTHWPGGEIDVMCKRVQKAPTGSVLVADFENDPAAVNAAVQAARARNFRTIVIHLSSIVLKRKRCDA